MKPEKRTRMRCIYLVEALIMASFISGAGAQNPADKVASGMASGLLAEFRDPPHEFSVMPFWFWNDDLKDDELLRQLADFEAHGVYGFVIHPRIGLPKEMGWLSPRMIQCMRLVIEEAARRKMHVVLYDEGMYPSGSSSGQVVARNPAHAARGLAKIDLKPGETPKLEPGWTLIATLDRPNGQRVAVVDRPSGGVIRGLHYIGDEAKKPKEDLPPAGDILNPEAVASFMNLVYDRYAQEFGQYFGKTILGIFTDEPSPMGRGGAKDMVPGAAAVIKQINRILGYDITPHLADLWYKDNADSARYKSEYHRAVNLCLEENFYKQLSEWCAKHGIMLMGHPAGSADLGAERYFQSPGQDLVWRYVEPGPKALEGEHSTMVKCASSAMIHLGRRRNSNELYGAYGHNLTYDEMVWLANWCFVRGHNLLFPHAFYYSIRGSRFDERPPDVGPHAEWWGRYKPYADACRRLSWINTDSRHICEVAILGESTSLPDKAAKVCFQHQRDFNYLELRHLWEDAQIDESGVRLAGMQYRAVIMDGLRDLPAKALPAIEKLAAAGRLISWNTARAAATAAIKNAKQPKSPEELIAAIDALAKPDVTLQPPSLDIRYRHVTGTASISGSASITGSASISAGEWSPQTRTGVVGEDARPRREAPIAAERNAGGDTRAPLAGRDAGAPSAGEDARAPRHFYLLFNEGAESVKTVIQVSAQGQRQWLDPYTAAASEASSEKETVFQPHEMKILLVSPEQAGGS
ncbi:MAG: glycosyl hydrolase [Candidatus Sumerlaeota bacterium]|nr:glycosyl hydrolase [Candidatus Sumerlaeota bacterium]